MLPTGEVSSLCSMKPGRRGGLRRCETSPLGRGALDALLAIAGTEGASGAVIPELLPDALDGCLILESRAVLAKRGLLGPPVGRVQLPGRKVVGLSGSRRERLRGRRCSCQQKVLST